MQLQRTILTALPLILLLGVVRPSFAGPIDQPIEDELGNGVGVVTQGWRGPEIADQVLISLVLEGGVYEEAPDQRGITRWLSEALATALRAKLQYPGEAPPTVFAEIDLEYVAIQLAIPEERYETQWPVIADTISDSSKSWTQFAPSTEALVSELLPLMEDGSFMTDLLLRTLIYANGPLVNPPLGTPPTLSALTQDQLHAWAVRVVQPDRCRVIVVHPEGVRTDILEEGLRDWQRTKDAPELLGISIAQPHYQVEALRPMPSTVPLLTLGVIGPSVRDPEHAAYLVAATALGDAQIGAFSTQLGPGYHQAIRVSWEVDRHMDSSLALLELAQDVNGNIFALHQSTLSLLEELLLTGLTDTEVARAQGQLQAALAGRESDPVALLSWLSAWSVWEHPTAGRRLETRISMLTTDEVNAVLREYFAIDKVAIAGLAPHLPDDYYFPSDDPYWGTFHRAPGQPTGPRDLIP